MALDAQRIVVFDSTLRDGAQAEGISFSVLDKLKIVRLLDELGVDYAEAGNPGSNPKDLEFFKEAAKLELQNVKLVAFGATRRANVKAHDDVGLAQLLSAGTQTVSVFGKSWDFQVTAILRTTLEENLAMIADTVAFLKAQDREVIFDAEHFFDGYKANRAYAMETLQAAVQAGASAIVLCDTRGGSLPSFVGEAVREVAATLAGSPVDIGIHTHNDSSCAEANSLVAVENGARHVQGTLVGFGERCGNANLAAMIPTLALKMGYDLLTGGALPKLTLAARSVAEIANIGIPEGMPYVGLRAFTHKGGMHIDGISKNPESFEHINPEAVGNERRLLMSEVAGRAMVLNRIQRHAPYIGKDDPRTKAIVETLKRMEMAGYQFEGAESSFELIICKHLGTYRPYFILDHYKTFGELPRLGDGQTSHTAVVKVGVDGRSAIGVAQGDGPVHALDKALRKVLEEFYPSLCSMRLTDYKVRVLDSRSATAAQVRVLIETTDGAATWSTVGVSTDIIEASWMALVDSIEYKLMKEGVSAPAEHHEGAMA